MSSLDSTTAHTQQQRGSIDTVNEQSPAPQTLIDDDVVVPTKLVTPQFVLEPLRAAHNESDYAAWTSSISHIRASPGFGPELDWPDEGMPLARNLRDVNKHDVDFQRRTGFTFTVLDPQDTTQVIGCVYLYPDPAGEYEVQARSWVTASRSELDPVLREAVAAWLREEWPFRSVRYAGLADPSGDETSGIIIAE